MIGTGGTIASEMTPDGLTPELTPTQLLRYVPATRNLCRVDCLSLYSIDSTNVTPAHWLGVANAIRENYDRYDGFVISHGTDTMAYTAAALSYLVQGADKAIILTGAQKQHRLQRPGHPRHPRAQDLFQELRRLFEHQLPRCGHFA